MKENGVHLFDIV